MIVPLIYMTLNLGTAPQYECLLCAHTHTVVHTCTHSPPTNLSPPCLPAHTAHPPGIGEACTNACSNTTASNETCNYDAAQFDASGTRTNARNCTGGFEEYTSSFLLLCGLHPIVMISKYIIFPNVMETEGVAHVLAAMASAVLA